MSLGIFQISSSMSRGPSIQRIQWMLSNTQLIASYSNKSKSLQKSVEEVYADVSENLADEKYEEMHLSWV